jgi:hypothetical protein
LRLANKPKAGFPAKTKAAKKRRKEGLSTLTSLRTKLAKQKRLGLLINFNVAPITDGITRGANGLYE